jgi:hypothetical protein
MANQVIGLDVEIKVANALAELRKLSPGADKEAKAIAGSLSKALKDAEKQAQATGKALQKTAEATKQVSTQTADLGTNGNKALKALGPLGGVLSKLSPEAGSAASSIAGLTSAFEGFEAAGLSALEPVILASLPLFGALAIAVGEVVGVMGDYTAANKAAEHAQQSLKLAMQPLSDAIKSAKDEQELLNDALESGNAKAYLNIADLSAKADAKEAEATAALRKEKEDLMLVVAGLADDNNMEGQLAKNRIAQIDEDIGAVHRQANEYARLTVANATTRKFIEGTKDETVKGTKAAAAHTDALKAVNDQLDAEAKLNERNTSTYRSAFATLIDIEAQATKATATKAEQMAIEHRASMQQIDDAEREALAVAGTESTKETATAQAVAARSATDAAYYAELDQMRTDDAAKAEAAAQAEIDKADAARAAELDARNAIAQQSADLAIQGIEAVAQANADASQREADLADGLQAQLIAGDTYYTDAQKAELQKRIEEHRKQARAAFGIAKAARIAEATITTAMAVVNALNDGLATGGPAGLVVGPVAAAAAGVAGGIQIASIAAEQPSFHQGYAPDERSARVLTSEAVLSPAATAALGSGNIAAANAGIMGGGRQASTPVVFRHQTFRPFIKDFLTQPSALSTALNAGKIVGHRARN